MLNWNKKYAHNREVWAERRGKEALGLILDGGKSNKQLMKAMGLSDKSLAFVLKTIRCRIWTVQFGKSRVYEMRPEVDDAN